MNRAQSMFRSGPSTLLAIGLALVCFGCGDDGFDDESHSARLERPKHTVLPPGGDPDNYRDGDTKSVRRPTTITDAERRNHILAARRIDEMVDPQLQPRVMVVTADDGFIDPIVTMGRSTGDEPTVDFIANHVLIEGPVDLDLESALDGLRFELILETVHPDERSVSYLLRVRPWGLEPINALNALIAHK